MKQPATIILAAGDFPKKGSPARVFLEQAQRVICCDHAADEYRRHLHRDPTVVIGDCDSVRGRFAQQVRIAEQETNDLEKAARFCRERGWSSPVVVGATGKREDHTIGNVFRALALNLEIVTDYGRFIPFSDKLKLQLPIGSALSVFAPDVKTRMTSVGLVWPLDAVRFANLYCATLNRTNKGRVILTTTRPALVYLPHVQAG